ncbi:MAG: hypothetical protein DMG16_12610 [Acidobacteria bacterium]|nr:MAG: hypothetical protein DMG16_12610 [Acidobacteriota bacterium]
MAHLGDKLAEYFYEELSSAEMTEARKHVEACIECRLDLERFESVHRALRTAPELEPPRHVVFSPRERRSWLSWLEWRTAATAGAAAALVAGILMGFSHQADRAWLAEELNKRDAEIQRLQAELTYYENFQRAVMRETLENGSAIQLLAQRARLRQ